MISLRQAWDNMVHSYFLRGAYLGFLGGLLTALQGSVDFSGFLFAIFGLPVIWLVLLMLFDKPGSKKFEVI